MKIAFVKAVLIRSRVVQSDARKLGLVKTADLQLSALDTVVTDPGLRRATESLFSGGHFTRAVEEGVKYLQHVVRERSKLTTDGSDLMRTAFSANNPLLSLSGLTTQSEKDEQRGYMDIMAGCVMAIRNPRAHSVGSFDDETSALEMLAIMNHLIGVARKAKVTRRRK